MNEIKAKATIDLLGNATSPGATNMSIIEEAMAAQVGSAHRKSLITTWDAITEEIALVAKEVSETQMVFGIWPEDIKGLIALVRWGGETIAARVYLQSTLTPANGTLVGVPPRENWGPINDGGVLPPIVGDSLIGFFAVAKKHGRMKTGLLVLTRYGRGPWSEDPDAIDSVESGLVEAGIIIRVPKKRAA
jgi:hypothetical protein